MARYGSLSVFLTSRSRVTVTWVNSLKSLIPVLSSSNGRKEAHPVAIS